MVTIACFSTRKRYKREYLSNTTQLACAFLASAATAPQGDPETILILTLICREKSGMRIRPQHSICMNLAYNKATNLVWIIDIMELKNHLRARISDITLLL